MAYMVTKSRSRCGGWDGSGMAEQTQIRSDHEKLRTRVVSLIYHQDRALQRMVQIVCTQSTIRQKKQLNCTLWMYLATLSAVDHKVKPYNMIEE